MKQIVCFTILILIVCTSCQKNFSTSEDEKVIAKLVETWDKNGLAGNRAENADFFTNDGVRVEGGKIYSGKESIRTLFSSQQEKRTYLKLENKIERIWSSENFITVTGIRTVSFIHTVTGDTITNKSLTVTVFERPLVSSELLRIPASTFSASSLHLFDCSVVQWFTTVC